MHLIFAGCLWKLVRCLILFLKLDSRVQSILVEESTIIVLVHEIIYLLFKIKKKRKENLSKIQSYSQYTITRHHERRQLIARRCRYACTWRTCLKGFWLLSDLRFTIASEALHVFFSASRTLVKAFPTIGRSFVLRAKQGKTQRFFPRRGEMLKKFCESRKEISSRMIIY